MPAIVALPQVVEDLVRQCGDAFPNEPARIHFAEYVTGLIVAEHKTVSGIAREFADAPDQSCLNRFLTESPWDPERLNQQRLEWLQADPTTRYRQDGVIAIDNTLIDHDGKLIEDVGYYWDHAEHRHVIAHDYLFANYVNPSGKHYPLDFRRFRKREQCEDAHPFASHTDLVRDMIDWVVAEDIPGNFTFDSYFTNAPVMNHIQHHDRGYIGDLKFNRVIIVKGQEQTVSAWVQTLRPWCRTKVTVGERTQWYYTTTVRIPKVNHLVRLLVLWSSADAAEPRKVLVTNRVHWEAHHILKVYRRRWTGTEPYHRDGKHHLGMGDCQLRDGLGQTRHMHLVMLVYSALMRQVKHDRALDWAQTRLMTIGESCRAIARETLRKTLAWAVEQAQRGMSLPEIQHQLALA
ncbi:MAG: IS701 family transposase [Kouleothrix sp.]|nr:IS701 family transposase [Kouleothrix sp.]